MRSILVIRLYFVGDVLLSTPVTAALRARFKDAHIAVLIKRRARDVLKGNPHIDEVIEYDEVERYHSPVWLWRLALRLRRRRYDLVVDLTGDHRSSLLLAAADPGFRVGLNHSGMGFLLDRRIPYRSEGHIVDHLLSSVEPVGAVAEDPVPVLVLTEAEMLESRELLKGARVVPDAPFVALSPGANWHYRRWPAQRFGALARMAWDRLGISSVVTGSATDVEAARTVVAGSSGTAVSLAGRTSIRTLAGVASLASAFVGNDSGPLHIAASQETPVVALFGPNTPERYAPRGSASRVLWPHPPCSPCSQKECVRPDNPCMEAITVDEVFAALASLIETKGRP
ncbi:lipopolysaccharide heptosyltransferase II [bacterium]|nr:lipopolysaccharide heptosyltransferase II [bacterium]